MVILLFFLDGDYLKFLDLSSKTQILPSTLDSHSTTISIPGVLPFGSQNSTSVYVSSVSVMLKECICSTYPCRIVVRPGYSLLDVLDFAVALKCC